MPYDVVVVGAGSAGATLAARLSEDPGTRVLLLEAGPVQEHEIPPEVHDGTVLRAAAPGHPATWSYPVRLSPERDHVIARGRVLGGSSAINGGVFVRARPEDHDGWAALGNEEWAYDRVLPVMRALEADLDLGPGPVHGGDGPVPVRRDGSADVATAAFREAALGLGYPDEPDKNAPGPPGVGPLPLNVVGGVRYSSARCYLQPARDRSNLEIRGGTVVRRVLIERGRAVGVEVSTAGQCRRIEAGEVVLAAGAVASPQLLMLSGLGPPEELAAHDIPVITPLPGVGREFTDHPQLTLPWRRRSDDRTAPGLAPFLGALHLTSPGGPGRGDLEIMLGLRPIGRDLAGELPLLVGLNSPDSRGRLSLRGADPDTSPRIDYRYLETAQDRAAMRAGLRVAATLLRTRPFAEVAESPADTWDLSDDGVLDRWITAHLGTAIHLSGTARMGLEGDHGAVTDQYGRVRGTDGLRLADTSILPTAPSRGTSATAVLIGEMVARFMRRGR